jgi:hypothetical protein
MASTEHLQIITAKLNELENVRVHEETGGVLMKKEYSWHLLSVYNLETLDICVNGELVADYDIMKINFVGQPTLFNCKKTQGINIFTLKDEKFIKACKTSKYRSIIDEVTKADIKLYFPDLFYITNNNLYDSGMIVLSVSPLIEIKVSFVNSYQHVHLINNLFVFVSYLPVSVVDKRIQIGDSLYSFYSTPSRTYRLEHDNKQIKVFSIYKFVVRMDKNIMENGEVFYKGTYRGMVVPHDHYLTFEIDGVWLGSHNDSFSILTPRKPGSGAVTKPASINL